MRKLLIAFPAAVLILVSLSLWGCGSDDDDPVGVSPEPCSIEITTLFEGSRFLPGAPDSQTVQIRWDKTGNSTMVNVDLLKGGTDVVRVVSGAVNHGYYSWRANNNGAEDGSDFSLRVSAFEDSTCSSLTGEFVLLNTIGCGFEFTNSFPDSVHADDVVHVSWVSIDIPGRVELHLAVGDEIRLIATDLDPDGSYDWTVDTFGLGDGNYYSLVLKDTKIPNYCFEGSDKFEIADPQ